jgi:hypothetical protein
MSESRKFDYDVPSPETLAGIYLSFGDADDAAQEQVPVQAQVPETGSPRLQDLYGITLTFEDSPGDSHLDNRPQQPPTAQPEQPHPGS